MQKKVYPLLGAAVFMLAACGQKGDLYLPGPPPTAASVPSKGVPPVKAETLNSNAVSVPPESAK